MLPRGKASYKIVLMGEAGVGKTSLIRRYVLHAFEEGYMATLGMVVSKHIDLLSLEDGRSVEVNLLIWDIMGQRGFMDLLQDAYFRGAQGALAVFDITRAETLEGLRHWIGVARREEPRIPIVVLGNKADLVAQRVVTNDAARGFCQALGLPYFPTSAKTGLNVEAAFRHLSREAFRTFASRGAEGPGAPPVAA